MAKKKKTMKLKDVLSEEIKTMNFINESVNNINLIESENKSAKETLIFIYEMKKMGVSNHEAEKIIEEQLDWLRSLYNKMSGDKDVTNPLSMGRAGASSQFKEFLIRKLLNYLGFEGVLADATATALSEMEIYEIAGMFRSKQGCNRHAGTVALALSEAVLSLLLSSTKKNSMAFNFMRNTLFEYLKQSQLKKQLAQLICNAAYKTSNEFDNIQ